MILRRLATSIRKQDWFAVVIETLIVVMGVYLGIQLGNWNAGRIQMEADNALIVRLRDEFSVVRDDLLTDIAMGTEFYESTGRVLAALRDDVEPENTPEWRQDLCKATFVVFLPRRPAAFEELQDTGALSRLNDLELHSALIRYDQVETQFQQIYPVLLAAVMNPGGHYYRAVSFNPDVEQWMFNDPDCVTGYDWELLKLSVGELQSWVGGQSDIVNRGTGQLVEVDTILQILSEGR